MYHKMPTSPSDSDGERLTVENRKKSVREPITKDVLDHARLISHRSKYWTPELENLLKKWMGQIQERQEEHQRCEQSYNARYYILGLPSALFTGLVSTGAIATFKNCDTCSLPSTYETDCYSDQWIRLAGGILGIIACAMGTATMFLNYGAATESHKSASGDYDELAREIDSILKTPVSMRGDPISTVQIIRGKFDDISRNAPLIPTLLPKKLRYKVVGTIDCSSDTETEDEDESTVLTFDPEAEELKRRRSETESLSKALQFELSRMYSFPSIPPVRDLPSIPEKPKIRKKRRSTKNIS